MKLSPLFSDTLHYSEAPVFIFDLDDTLSNSQHRKHLLESSKPNWVEFFKRSKDDPLITKVRDLAVTVRASGAEIWIWTGRSDEVKADTVLWLEKYGITENIVDFENPTAFKMRSKNDTMPDHQLKIGWYRRLSEINKKRIICVFEDRDTVVHAWRKEGVLCCQVKDGDF